MIVPDFKEYATIFEEQYLKVLDKSKTKFEEMNLNFILNINKYTHKNSFLLVSRDKSDIIRSTVLVIEENDCLTPLYLGINYDICTESEIRIIYFNTIFKVILEAEVRGKKAVLFGQTSYYPKIMSGALVQRGFLGFNSNNIIIQYCIKNYFGKLFPKTDVHTNIYSSLYVNKIKTLFHNIDNL